MPRTDDGRKKVDDSKNGPPRSVPTVQDLALLRELSEGHQRNIPIELITGSLAPEEYLPRGRHDKKSIARRKRLTMKHSRKKGRGVRFNEAIWVGDQMNIGLDGEARREVIKCITATREVEVARGWSGLMRGQNRVQNGNHN